MGRPDWRAYERMVAYVGECNQMTRRLQDEMRDLKSEAEALEAQLDLLIDGLNAIYELHQRIYESDGRQWCQECRLEWPCPTSRVVEELARRMPQDEDDDEEERAAPSRSLALFGRSQDLDSPRP